MVGFRERGKGFVQVGGLALALVLAVACKESTKAPESGGPGVTPVAGTTPAPETGGPLPKIFHALPGDTNFVFALTDLDRMRADFKQTVLYQAWMDPNLTSWREQSWPRIRGAIEEKIEVSFKEIGDLLHGDMALIVGLRAAPGMTEPEPRAAFLFRPTTNRAQVEAFVAKITKDEEPGDESVIRWAGDVLILAQNEGLATEIESNMTAGRSPLEAGAAYGTLRSGYASDAFAHIWLNVDGIIEVFKQAPPDEGFQQALPVLDELGFENLASVYVNSAVDGQGFRGTARLQCEGAREGILTWIGASGPSKALPLAPEDTRSFFSLRHAGAGQILSTIKLVAMAGGEVTETDWQRGLAEVGAMLGFEIESTLPRLIGNELAFVYGGGSIMAMELSVLIESSDPAGLIKLIETALAAGNIRATVAEYRGVGYQYFTVPNAPFWVCMGEMSGFVVVSSQQTAYRKIVDAVKNRRSLADNPRYKTATAGLEPAGWMDSFSTVDPSAGPTLAMVMPIAAQGLSEALGIELTANDLPNLQVFIDHMIPTVSRGYSEPNAIEFRSKSAFNGTMVAGGLAAIAVPGFMRAREVARATSCQENLIKLEGAVDQWAVEFDKTDGSTVPISALVGPTMYLKRTPRCRGGGEYPAVLTVGETPTCDYIPPEWFDTQGDKYKHRVPDVAF